MKKILSLFTILIAAFLLSACTPDENTAGEIQQWYDECELIESCAAKIDELREGELSESEIINEIEQSIADHEAELQRLAEEQAAIEAELERQRIEQEEHAKRIADLELRVTRLETLTLDGILYDLLIEYRVIDHEAIYVYQGDGYIEISVEWDQVKNQEELTEQEIEDGVVLPLLDDYNIILDAIVLELSDVINPEEITIVIIMHDQVISSLLSDLLTPTE